ncbi:uncharacterized protein [Dipodomys merriami]|uniref:uncharacterized protein isoform X5 n=1 Tax=Dipodomys merriami TaxID=94247 RepID=UPI003855A09F
MGARVLAPADDIDARAPAAAPGNAAVAGPRSVAAAAAAMATTTPSGSGSGSGSAQDPRGRRPGRPPGHRRFSTWRDDRWLYRMMDYVPGGKLLSYLRARQDPVRTGLPAGFPRGSV